MTRKQKHRWIVKETASFLRFKEGCFIECGVKQGTSSRLIAQEFKRQGYLFDTWSGFPHFSKHDYKDESRHRRLTKRVRSKKSVYQDCKKNLRDMAKYCTLIKGDICKTVPKFVSNYNIVIDLLHIDTDLYKPAYVSLINFFPILSTHGITLVHDYKDGKWPGIQKVVDNFVSNTGCYILDLNDIYDVSLAALSKDNMHEYAQYLQSQYNRYTS